ncbi:MAG: phosphodiester glycosidase family protein [Spirochaetales bacterium]|nr:phosphodiester glycosidase family protein [Spirochaetales bacterium]
MSGYRDKKKGAVTGVTVPHNRTFHGAGVLLTVVTVLVLCGCQSNELKTSGGSDNLRRLPVVGARALPRTGMTPDWEKLYDGIELSKVTMKNPPLRVYCIRMDLTEKGIELIVSEGIKNSKWEAHARRTSTFFREKKCLVAINGSMFEPYRITKEGQGVNVTGVFVSNGYVYSDVDGKLSAAALVVTKKNKFSIESAPHYYKVIKYAVGGLPNFLLKGDAWGSDEETDRHPRTAVGLSGDTKYLYLMVVDGRSKESVGATELEAAEWLKFHGAYNGLNMDGGGSSVMIIAGKNGKPVILNHPSDSNGNTDRIVANHIGIVRK